MSMRASALTYSAPQGRSLCDSAQPAYWAIRERTARVCNASRHPFHEIVCNGAVVNAMVVCTIGSAPCNSDTGSWQSSLTYGGQALASLHPRPDPGACLKLVTAPWRMGARCTHTSAARELPCPRACKQRGSQLRSSLNSAGIPFCPFAPLLGIDTRLVQKV
eukprot:360246-Chlamydomonas_euryale.AAC.2